MFHEFSYEFTLNIVWWTLFEFAQKENKRHQVNSDDPSWYKRYIMNIPFMLWHWGRKCSTILLLNKEKLFTFILIFPLHLSLRRKKLLEHLRYKIKDFLSVIFNASRKEIIFKPDLVYTQTRVKKDIKLRKQLNNNKISNFFVFFSWKILATTFYPSCAIFSTLLLPCNEKKIPFYVLWKVHFMATWFSYVICFFHLRRWNCYFFVSLCTRSCFENCG